MIALLIVPALSVAAEPRAGLDRQEATGIGPRSAATGLASGPLAPYGGLTVLGARFVPDPVGPTQATGKVQVSVRVTEPGSGVTSLDIDFRYDPLVLRPVSGSLGAGLPGGWSGSIGMLVPGNVAISAFGTAALPPTGESEIAVFTFEVITPCDPTDELHFTFVQFNESEVCDERNGSSADDCTGSHAPGVDHGAFNLSCGILRASENVIGRVGGYAEVPITLRYADAAHPVAAVDMIVEYDATKLSYRGAFVGPSGPGEPMRGWSVLAYEYAPGRLDLGAYWTGPDGEFLTCSAVIAALNFAVTGASDQTAAVVISGDANGDGTADWLHLNEGMVASCVDDGYVSLTSETCDGLDNDGDGTIDEGGSALCDDGLWCNGQEICGGTAGCLSGASPCNDGKTCTDDACLEATRECVNDPNDGNCNDGEPCTTDACDPSNPLADPNGCVHTAAANGTPCGDGYACTDNDQCTNGVCGGTPNDAHCGGDGNPCTQDVCSPGAPGANADGCYPYAAGGTSCPDDGNECTSDTCQAGSCAHPARADQTACTADINECTNDWCVSGVCDAPRNGGGDGLRKRVEHGLRQPGHLRRSRQLPREPRAERNTLPG